MAASVASPQLAQANAVVEWVWPVQVDVAEGVKWSRKKKVAQVEVVLPVEEALVEAEVLAEIISLLVKCDRIAKLKSGPGQLGEEARTSLKADHHLQLLLTIRR